MGTLRHCEAWEERTKAQISLLSGVSTYLPLPVKLIGRRRDTLSSRKLV